MVSISERAVIDFDTPTTNLSTALLDVNLRFMKWISWHRAMTMYARGSINIVQPYYRETPDGFRETVVLRTPSQDIPLPFIVTQKRFVYDPYAAYVRSNSPIATKRAILTRDNFVCAYQYRLGEVDENGDPVCCTYKGTTVDHIYPQSRGGENTWENLITACQRCNNAKRDRTPEEAGMPLLFKPETYDGGRADTEAEIHQFLMSESGALHSTA